MNWAIDGEMCDAPSSCEQTENAATVLILQLFLNMYTVGRDYRGIFSKC